MVGNAKMYERMDVKISRHLMKGLIVEEAGGSWRGGESYVIC